MFQLKRHPILLFLLVLALVAFFAVKTATSDPSLRYAVDSLADRLHEQYGLELEVSHLIAEPGSARVSLGPVFLKDSDGELLFSAKHIVAEIAPLQMFARSLQLDSLEVDEPFINLRVLEGKIVGIERLGRDDDKKRSDPLLRVDAKDFRVRRGKVVINVDNHQSLDLSDIAVRLRSRGPDGHRLRFKVGQAELIRPGDRLVVERFGGRLILLGEGLLAPKRISVSDITLATDDANLSLAGSVLFAEEAGLLPALDIDINTVVDLPKVVSHLDLPMEVLGRVSLGARYSSDFGLKNPTVYGQADVEGLRVAGYGVGAFRGNFVATEDRLDIPDGTFQSGDSVVQASATLDLNGDFNFEVDAKMDEYSLHQLLTDIKRPGSWADLRLNGDVRGKGRLKPHFFIDGEFNGGVRNLRVGGRDAATVEDDDLILRIPHHVATHLAITATHEAISFDGGFDDDFSSLDVRATLYYGARGYEIHADAKPLDFQSVIGRVGRLRFLGRGNTSFHLKGPYPNPLITAEAEFNGLSLNEYELGDVGADVHYHGRVLSFSEIDAVKDRSMYRGDVAIDYRQRPAKIIEIDVEFADTRFEELRSIIPSRIDSGAFGFIRKLDIDGRTTGNLSVLGDISGGTTDDLHGEAQLRLESGSHFLGQSLRHGVADLSLTQETFVIDAVELAMAGGSARLQGSIQRDGGALAGGVQLSQLSLAQFSRLQKKGRSTTGALSMQTRLAGTVKDPQLYGQGMLRNLRIGDYRFGNADLKIMHKDRRLHLTGPVFSERAKINIEIETENTFDYSANLEVAAGPARSFLPNGTLPEKLEVLWGGSIDAAGSLKALSESRGTIDLDSFQLKYNDVKLDNGGHVLAHFKGPQLTIDQLQLGTKKRDVVELSGVMSSDLVDMQLASRGDLWWLPNVLSRAKEAKGRYQVDLAITGDLSDASMTGTGHVSKGQLQLNGFENEAREIDARLIFRGSNVLVESLRGRVGDAPIAGQGVVTFRGFKPHHYDLELSFEELQTRIPRWLAVKSSGRVQLRGPAAMPTLGGEVEIHQALYSEDFDWDRLLPDLRRDMSAPSVFDPSEEDLRYDLHLVADNGIVVDNNAMDLEAKGDLYLVGTEERTGLKGNISLLRGHANFRNNRYQLTNGTVEFVDTYRITPALDISAETSIKEYDIDARVIGELKNLEINLSSRPDLPEIDILALLAFGFTQYEVAGDTGNLGGISAGLEVVSAYAGLEKEVQRLVPDDVKAFDLDELRLTSMFSNLQGANLPAVSMGLQLKPSEISPSLEVLDNSRLRLQSTVFDAGGGAEQRAELEKRFGGKWRVRLVWNSQNRGACPQCVSSTGGDWGGDLWYHWEF